MSTQVLIADTHFGVKNNSINWLNSQKSFIYNDLIPFIKKRKKEDIELIHLGDLFDSRSSINPMVWEEVNSIIKDIYDVVNKIVIIGGNHDFYSPIDTDDNVTSLKMLKSLDNLIVLYNDSLQISDDSLAMPWFEFHNIDKLESILDDFPKTKNIFTHTDYQHLDPDLKKLIDKRNINIITGHVHTPYIKGNEYTLGSCFALTFADSNQDRGFYTIEDYDLSTLKFYPNTESIKFYRVKNDDILDFDKARPIDMVELYIDEALYSMDSYQNAMSELANTTPYVKTFINPIEVVSESVSAEDNSIIEIVKANMKDSLKDKFDRIVENS